MRFPLYKFTQWLENKNLKERTIENYVYYYNKFTFDLYNQETVSKFLSQKSNRNSIGRGFLVNLRKFLMVNYKELDISIDQRLDVSEVELPKLSGRPKQRIIKPMPHEQISLLEQHLYGENLKLMLLISYYCGLRLGELLKIKILSFNWESWKKDPEKMGECRVLGKGDKEGVALVPSSIMKRVAKFIKNKRYSSLDSYVFIDAKGKTNFKNKGRIWQQRLLQAGIDSGITKLDENKKPIKETIVHPHRLRHSYATYLLNVKGLDMREVQEILRHSSIQSTQIYIHIDKEHLKKKLEGKY